MTVDPIITRIEAAVGETCYWWSAIEHLVHDICLHLASCLSLDYENSVTRVPLHMALTNMGLRERIATAKAFASQAPTANRTFYSRLERILNCIDNELRSERNRYVHDLWMIGDDKRTVERFHQRTVVSRPQSHRMELAIGTTRSFASVDDVEFFTNKLESAFHALSEIDSETATMVAELERAEALRRSALPDSENSSSHEMPE